MKFFNVEIQTTEDGTAQAIYQRDSEDDAITAFHNSMASMRAAVDAGTLKECTGLILNSWGGIVNPHVEHYAPNSEEG